MFLRSLRKGGPGGGLQVEPSGLGRKGKAAAWIAALVECLLAACLGLWLVGLLPFSNIEKRFEEQEFLYKDFVAYFMGGGAHEDLNTYIDYVVYDGSNSSALEAVNNFGGFKDAAMGYEPSDYSRDIYYDFIPIVKSYVDAFAQFNEVDKLDKGFAGSYSMDALISNRKKFNDGIGLGTEKVAAIAESMKAFNIKYLGRDPDA